MSSVLVFLSIVHWPWIHSQFLYKSAYLLTSFAYPLLLFPLCLLLFLLSFSYQWPNCEYCHLVAPLISEVLSSACADADRIYRENLENNWSILLSLWQFLMLLLVSDNKCTPYMTCHCSLQFEQLWCYTWMLCWSSISSEIKSLTPERTEPLLE